MSSSDPLTTLGPALFIDVLSRLPARALASVEQVCSGWRACAGAYASGLWRCASVREGVGRADLIACDALARTGVWSVKEEDTRALVRDPVALLLREERVGGTPDAGTRVNWRHVCKTHKDMENAWATGRCRLRWITPPLNTVWRIKADAEQNTFISTSRRFRGLSVVDRDTSEPLFGIRGLEPYSHIEAGRGFVVFNTPGQVGPLAGVLHDDDNGNTAVEVWRTAEARARATIPSQGESSVAGTAYSVSSPEFQPMVRGGPLPRGHMEHFRTLQPPDDCFAFRLHVDNLDTDNERAVFAAAAPRAAFIWHLEDNSPMDRIERSPVDRGSPNYIELDDDYFFICLDTQVQVYSRSTLKHIVAFPPRGPARDTAALGFALSLSEDFKAVPDAERLSVTPTGPDGVRADVSRAVLHGTYRPSDNDDNTNMEDGFDEAVRRAIAMHPIRLRPDQDAEIEYGFTACHFTPTDLVCTTRSGAVFIVRSYAAVFRAAISLPEDGDERAKLVAQNTIIIGLGTTIRQLTTFGYHIVLCTSFNIILLDGRNLPPLPPPGEAPADPHPALRAHMLAGNHPQAMKMSSCLQADVRSVYLTYWAMGEAEATGGISNHTSFPTDAALAGDGMCVKVWTFGLE